jgi:DNA-binding HxlR family transcriptional regulator
LSKLVNVFVRISKKQKIIQLCAEPMRFRHLRREVGISDAGLAKNLKALQKLGWLQKNEDMYELTRAGRRILPQAKIVESILTLNFKTSPVLAKNVTVSHQGLEGDDRDMLLSEIAQATGRYVAKHSYKPITLLIQYSPATAPSTTEPT